MKITCFSINPIFADHVTGGASKHLLNLCRYLASHGHDIVILATQAATGQEPFQISEHIKVKPVLPFHQPFPQPYQVSPGDLAVIAEVISDTISNSDRFYIHDGELLLPFLYSNIPTVISYRDNYYPESILGSFISQADAIIAVSEFSASVLKASAGRAFPELIERINTVVNGIDTSKFHATDPTKFLEKFGIDPAKDQVMLHPHRPEVGKGLHETIQVTDILVNQYGFDQIKVLVPQWLSEMNGEVEDNFHRQILKELKDRHLESHFIFHPWLSQEQMPAYYSAGKLTLCLGNLVEAFGNVAYESLACGTPSLVARVGVHRSQLPDDLIDKVDYGDIETAAAKAASILHNRSRIEGEKLKRVISHFSIDKQLESYEAIIINASKQPALRFQPSNISPNTRFSLAPWCYHTKSGIYHDYRGEYSHSAELMTILEHSQTGIGLGEVIEAGADWDKLSEWYRQGYLIPETQVR